MFVVMNILQHRAAHLHTSFMVKCPQFENIANKLTKVSPDVLLSTACHLEQEGRYADLDSSQQEVSNTSFFWPSRALNKVSDPGHTGVLLDNNKDKTITAVEVGDKKKDFVL